MLPAFCLAAVKIIKLSEKVRAISMHVVFCNLVGASLKFPVSPEFYFGEHPV